MKQESYFDGGLLSYVGHSILAGLITILTLGICAPWGICIMINWKVKHTVIDGHRLALTEQPHNSLAIGLSGSF